LARGKSSRIEGLDGLRGLASLVVVLRHTSNAIAMPWDLRRALIEGPLALLLNSQGAVQLFFVLSGYVLARSLERNSGWVAVVGFCAKRILRIHPPYVLTVLAYWILSFFFVTSHRGHHPADPRPSDLDWQQLASVFDSAPWLSVVPQGWT
jgi:peptidoglycan/LPS O-acetylase OafA/YrhL